MPSTTPITGRNVAVLATHGFEQSELEVPVERLREAGATVHVISPESGAIRGWDGGDWGEEVPVDTTLAEADAEKFDALVLPGGVMNPDTLRQNEDALAFVRAFFSAGKPVSAICHGPQVLIDADVLEGRSVTSFASIKNDLKNAGARWSDQEVVCESGLTTSRTPADLDAFVAKTIEEIGEGVHAAQATA